MGYSFYRQIKVSPNLKNDILNTFCVKFEDDDEYRYFNYHLPLDFDLQMELEDIDNDDELDDLTKEQQKKDMEKMFLGDPKKYIDSYSFDITFEGDDSMTIHLSGKANRFSNIPCGRWIMKHYPDYPFEVLDYDDDSFCDIPAINQLYDDELTEFMSYDRFIFLNDKYYQDILQSNIIKLLDTALGNPYKEDFEYKFLKLLMNNFSCHDIFKKYQNKDFETLKAEVLERKKAKEEEHMIKAELNSTTSKF